MKNKFTRFCNALPFPGILSLLGIDSAYTGCKAAYGIIDKILKRVTGCPGELGLLKESVSVFNDKHGTGMCRVKVGSARMRRDDITMLPMRKNMTFHCKQFWIMKEIC
jgi:hypothetical protein